MLAAILTTFAKSHSPQRKPGLANRLWAYQLQEEELKKDAKSDSKGSSSEVQKVQEQDRSTVSQVKAPRKIGSSKKLEPTEELRAFIPFKTRPIRTFPSAYEKLAELEPLSLTFSSVLALRQTVAYNVLKLDDARIKRRKQARRRAAAFLLLAA